MRHVWSKVEPGRTTKIDFCHLFEEEMSSLYVLAFLLTADHNLAEECFMAGLSDCLATGASVFEQWALTWSKRAVIKNAIRVVGSAPTVRSTPAADCSSKSPLAQAILELGHFSRVVFVMSLLEGYSDKECALLLSCMPGEVAQARADALRKLATSTGLETNAARCPNKQHAPGTRGRLAC